MKGVFVTATDTGVGKTIVTGMLAKALGAKPLLGNAGKRGQAPGYDVWKPVQSGTSVDAQDSDGALLHRLSGLAGDASERVGATYLAPLAPWVSARREAKEVPYAQLVIQARRRLEERFCLIEGAGGLLVPLTESHTIADFAGDLQLPILIVARPGLGTVNHTLLTIEVARARGLRVLGVVINGVTAEHEEQAISENVEMIERFGQVAVVGVVPWLTESEIEAGHPVFEHILGRILS
jgi:dethiobiotin synthetase